MLSVIVGAIISGGATSKTGYYMAWVYLSVILTTTGSGLPTTFATGTGHVTWIEY